MKVRVVTEPTPFPKVLPVNRISVNSFGYGGTNAHVIIEGADSLLPFEQTYRDSEKRINKKPRGAINRNRPFLLLFSAHDSVTLKNNIAAYSTIAHRHNLHDLSYTLANRRTNLHCRGFTVASQTNLEKCFSNDGEAFTIAEKKKPPTLGFVFTGQGAQWAMMGSKLMVYYPSFLESIRILDRSLGGLPDCPDWTLEDVLLEGEENSRINEAEFSQPLCTAIQIAIVQLLELWGIRPVVTVGHSSGEIAAAFAAGLITATEAIIVAYYRGKAVCDINVDGAMMAVGVGVEEVEPYIKDMSGKVVVACHNSPASITLSGDANAIAIVKTRLDAQKIFVRYVKTGGRAYHSHHMKLVAARYMELLRVARVGLNLDPPHPLGVTMVSSVTNSKINSEIFNGDHYWSDNLCSPVLFSQAIQTIATDIQFTDVDLLIEIGPHSALSGPIRQTCASFGFETIGYLPTLVRNTDSALQLLKLAGELFLRDYPLDTERITSIEEPRPGGKTHISKGSVIVDLPTYQWNYAKDFWAEPRRSREHRAPQHPRHDVLGSLIAGGSKSVPVWRNVLRIRDIPWLQHHSLGGEAVFPAAGYFAMAIEALTQLHENSLSPVQIEGYVLRNVAIKAALVTPDNDTGIEVLCSLKRSIFDETATANAWWDFNISSISESGHENDHVAGSIAINLRHRAQTPKTVPDFPQRTSGKAWNQALREVGFDYGLTFQDMTDIRFDGKNYAAACKTAIKSTCGIMEDESRYVLHPSTVDSCLQLIIVSIYAGRLNDMTCGAVPVQVDEVAIWVPTADQVAGNVGNVFSWTEERGFRSFVTDSQLTASDGELLLDIINMRCTAYEAAIPQRIENSLISSQPYGEMVWMRDIDSLGSSGDLDDMDVGRLVELAVFKNPALKVIEVGSKLATGILSKWELLDYTCMATSNEVVEELGSTLQKWKNARAQRFDDQTGNKGSVDLVIATVELEDSSILTRIHKLLKPGGFAILETSGELSPNILRDAGFSGINSVVTQENTSLSLCTASPLFNAEDAAKVHYEIQLIYRKEPACVVAELNNEFEGLGWEVTISSLENHQSKAGEHVIMLADFEGPLLSTLEEKELAAIQNITSAASNLLWVSCGGLFTGKSPEYAMATGLARSVSSEQNSLNFSVLDFDLENTSTGRILNIITTTVQRQRMKLESFESDYYVSNGLVYITRLTPNAEINRLHAFDKQETISTPFEPTVPLIGKIQSGKVVFEADSLEEMELGPSHIELNVFFAGLNKEDTMVIAGSDYPDSFSHEICGVIRRVGELVVGLEVGDHVFGFSFSKFATIQRVPADLVQKIGVGEDMLNLVALPMAYSTALYGLKDLAQLEAKQTVLILSGTGVPGLAAIKISQLMNAIPYVVVSDKDEATMIMADYGLGEGQILMTSELPIILQLKKSNGGRGPDVVFSSGSVDAHVSRECWRNMEPFGRFVDSGRKNALKRSSLDTCPLHRGASYLSFDILDLYRWKPQVMGNLLRRTAILYRQKLITPPKPVTIMKLGEIDSAVASFSDHFGAGKILISYEASDTQLNILKARPSLRLRPDATYLLVGCLGGLGRSLTSWMMKKGARRFAFLSRSGTDSEQAARLVNDIEAMGVVAQVIRGDASIMRDVERAVKTIPTEHPVCGVVQAAMVLKVSLLIF